MEIKEILEIPTTLGITFIKECLAEPNPTKGFHESLTRSHHVLNFACRYLRAHEKIEDTGIILDIIHYLLSENKERTATNS